MTREERKLIGLARSAMNSGDPGQVIIGRMTKKGAAANLAPSTKRSAFRTWERADATEWLRKFGGVGGACAANLVENPPAFVALWMIILHADWLHISAYDDDGVMTDSATRFDGLNLAACEGCMKQQRPGSARLAVQGGTLVAHAPEPMTAALGVGLAYAVFAGRLKALCLADLPGAKRVELPVGDVELGLLLERGYARQPAAVAAAVQALKRLGDGREQRLIDALDANPALRHLREGVATALAATRSEGVR